MITVIGLCFANYAMHENKKVEKVRLYGDLCSKFSINFAQNFDSWTIIIINTPLVQLSHAGKEKIVQFIKLDQF
jgi:hypothetical protein